MVYAGAIIVHGRTHGVVVATGPASAVGQLALDVLAHDTGQPPLVERMQRFSRRIAVAVLVAAALIGALGMLVHQHGPVQMLMFGIALAISAIPEGLPVALTVALSIGTTRMAKRGVIVRRLAAVEGLGSCTLVASDKTGTLTCNELTVREIRLCDGNVFAVTGQGFAPEGQVLDGDAAVDVVAHPGLEVLARATVLCNEADLHSRDAGWTWRGDPTDVALLAMGRKIGFRRESMLEAHPQLAAIAFEPEHRFAATYHRFDDAARVFVKGAPERVLDMCAVDGDERARIDVAANDMADNGLRVLMLAHGASARGHRRASGADAAVGAHATRPRRHDRPAAVGGA